MGLFKCPTCKREISTNARACPHCGECDFSRALGTEEIPCSNCKGKGKVPHPVTWMSHKKGIGKFFSDLCEPEVECTFCNGKGTKTVIKRPKN